jgi:hypothetical protein
MQFSEFVALVWLKYRGKGADKSPSNGEPRWNNILAITNQKVCEKWAKDPDNNWGSLFRIDTLVAADVVNLSADFAKVSDTISVVLNGNTYYFACVPPQKRNVYADSCYVSGLDGAKTLTFTKGIPTLFVGGSLSVPINYKPAKIVDGTSTVICDSLEWLKCEVAAEMAQGDPSKDDKYPDLVAEASNEYTKMVLANQGVGFDQPLEATTDMEDMA